ncbi:hypothetical protein Acr_29g0000020 [Actinidia rufa]|uniref:Uncharacterized protein n=1 Tax=Actinidia rufa TaxID=165716 RepID=A0A7J0HCI0_9ERIC|nr:hypothetical protein Acr_29g0000020 [Actinidia rufa]
MLMDHDAFNIICSIVLMRSASKPLKRKSLPEQHFTCKYEIGVGGGGGGCASVHHFSQQLTICKMMLMDHDAFNIICSIVLMRSASKPLKRKSLPEQHFTCKYEIESTRKFVSTV